MCDLGIQASSLLGSTLPQGLGVLCIELADKGQERGEAPVALYKPQPRSDLSLLLTFPG